MTEDKSFEKTLESLLVNVFLLYPDPVSFAVEFVSLSKSGLKIPHFNFSDGKKNKSLMRNLLTDHGT